MLRPMELPRFIEYLLASTLWFGCSTRPPDRVVSPIRINELNPTNRTWQDELGNFGAWIELYNAASEDTDITGYFISNSVNYRFKYAFDPGVVVPANGILLVWADANSNRSTEMAPHLDFKLKKNDDGIWLSNPNGYLVDSIEYVSVPANDAGTESTSLARFPDGTGNWQWCSRATPTKPNGNECLGQSL